MFLSFLIPFSFIAIVIFIIVAIMEGKHTSKKSTVIRSVYFYLTSLVTLGIVVGSVIFLFNLGLKSWVFTEAESVYTRIGPPSTLFLADDAVRELTKLETLNCEEECTLTESNKNNITLWGNNYESWKESKDNPYSNRYNDLAAALSFLIIALPFFIIHYRIVQKDAKKDEEDEDKKVIRPTYYYFISLGFIINDCNSRWNVDKFSPESLGISDR